MKREIWGNIFNFQKFSVHDGPGIRTLVFFQGCPLNCYWCANPEGIDAGNSLRFKAKECSFCGKCAQVCENGNHIFVSKKEMVGPKRENFAYESIEETEHQINRDNCTNCGKCAQECSFGAIKISGAKYSVDDVFKIVNADKVFYQTSGGGITLGGGEPTLQPEFAIAILKKCKENGINTAIETCANTSIGVMEEIRQYVDYFIVDLKHLDDLEHKVGVGKSNEIILKNIENLFKKKVHLTIRIPIIPAFNDSKTAMELAASFIKKLSEDNENFQGVELLPYHKLGIEKYNEIGENYIGSLSESIKVNKLEELKIVFLNKGIKVI